MHRRNNNRYGILGFDITISNRHLRRLVVSAGGKMPTPVGARRQCRRRRCLEYRGRDEIPIRRQPEVVVTSTLRVTDIARRWHHCRYDDYFSRFN